MPIGNQMRTGLPRDEPTGWEARQLHARDVSVTHLLVRGRFRFLKKSFHACRLPGGNKCLWYSTYWMWLVINWLLIRYRGPGLEVQSTGIYLLHRPHCTSINMAKPLFALLPYLRAGSIVIKQWQNARCHLTEQTSTFSITVERTSVFKDGSGVQLNWVMTTGYQEQSFDWTTPSF